MSDDFGVKRQEIKYFGSSSRRKVLRNLCFWGIQAQCVYEDTVEDFCKVEAQGSRARLVCSAKHSLQSWVQVPRPTLDQPTWVHNWSLSLGR